jgi:uncharacterized protein YndB with AHSA1/START domain
MNVEQEINAIRREVGDRVLEAGTARVVKLTRDYRDPVEDVWDALTNAERIPRWFLPIEGDLRLGGRYQLQGNAGGKIEACDPPRSFSTTWEFNEAVSWLTVTLEATDAGGTRFILEHFALAEDERAREFWDQFGPGAVGVGWDGAVLGLSLHLATGEDNRADPEAWAMSEEGKRFSALSSEAWGEAAVAWGADPEWAKGAVARTTAFYTGVPA